MGASKNRQPGRSIAQLAGFGVLAVYSSLAWSDIATKADKTNTVSPSKAVSLAPSLNTSDFLQVFLWLLVVVVTMIVVLWAVRRLGRFSSLATNHIRILGGVNLGARERLLVVQVGDQQLVLGVAPGSIRTLHVLANPIPVELAQDKFALLLKERLKNIFKSGENR